MTDAQTDPNAEPGGELIGDGGLPSGGLGAPATDDSAVAEAGIRNPFSVGDDEPVTEVDTTTDPTLDSDHDGLANVDEVAAGTDPYESDTDGDGMTDGEEAWIGTDPFEVDNEDYVGMEGVDSDGDGLSDAVEDAYGYDPESRDSDDDGMTDGHEEQLGTDALVEDTDDDGILDGDELDDGTDPLSGEAEVAEPETELVEPELDGHDHGAVEPDVDPNAFSDQFGEQFGDLSTS